MIDHLRPDSASLDVGIWMPIKCGDFLKETMALDAEAVGALVRLLLYLWTHGVKPLQDDDSLSRITGVPLGRWRNKVRAAVAHVFVIENGMWRLPALEEEYAKATANRAAARRKAHLGGVAAKRKRDAERHGTKVLEAPPEQRSGGTQASTKHRTSPSASPLSESSVRSDGEPRPLKAKGGFRQAGGLLSSETGSLTCQTSTDALADQRMAAALEKYEGFSRQSAWELVVAGRDPNASDSAEAIKRLVEISKKHGVGWFHKEAEQS